MGDCKLLGMCPFFNDRMARMPRSTEIMKERFCRGGYEECARYIVFEALGKEKMPANLFPNEVNAARDLVSRKGRVTSRRSP